MANTEKFSEGQSLRTGQAPVIPLMAGAGDLWMGRATTPDIGSILGTKGSWNTSWNRGKKLRQEPCFAWMSEDSQGRGQPSKMREETEEHQSIWSWRGQAGQDLKEGSRSSKDCVGHGPCYQAPDGKGLRERRRKHGAGGREQRIPDVGQSWRPREEGGWTVEGVREYVLGGRSVLFGLRGMS